jgi:hypothetical protein
MKIYDSESEETADAIHQKLRQEWPDTIFTIIGKDSEQYDQNNSVSIEWSGGPTVEQLEEITQAYVCGPRKVSAIFSFTERNIDTPQVNAIYTHRI